MLQQFMAAAGLLAGLLPVGGQFQAAARPGAVWTSAALPAGRGQPPLPSPWAGSGAAVATGAASSQLDGVSCAPGGQCAAVGYAALAGSQPPVVEDLVGGTWQLMTLPPVPGSLAVRLTSISCGGPGRCTAVGYYQPSGGGAEQPLVEVLANGVWSTTPIASVGKSAELTGVWCATATSCVAVGWYSDGAHDQTLVETLAAGGWSMTPSASPGARDNVMEAVTCAHGGACSAVGYYQGATGGRQPLVETAAGSHWSVVPVAARGTGDNVLAGVSCATATSCVAVGYYSNGHADQTLVDVLAQGKWAPVVPSPDASVANNELAGVACAAAGQCTAVGGFSTGQSRQALVLVLAAGRWKAVKPVPGQGNRALAGVSCGSQGCDAVGWQALYGSPVHVPLAALEPGSIWQVVPTAIPQGADDQLVSVSCPAPGQCAAVGSSVTPSGLPVPLIEMLVGGTWDLEPPLSPVVPGVAAGAPAYLDGVSCSAVGQCAAVGYYVDSAGVPQSLIEVLAGGLWSVAASPGVGSSAATYLDGVSCPPGGGCTAVGYFVGTSGQAVPMAVSGTGATWSLRALPAVGPGAARLFAVSCSQPGQCTAVGSYTSGNVSRALVEVLAAGSWAQAAAASTGQPADVLSAVSCLPGGQCLAVGYSSTSHGDRPLVESPSGGHWAVLGSPAVGATGGRLAGVSCVSATSCVATGYQAEAGSTAERPVVSVLGSGSWLPAAAYAGASGQAARLVSVSCTGALDCTAVGWYADGGSRWPLADAGNAAPSSPLRTSVKVQASVASALVGAPVTFTATVSPVPAGGSVTFIDNGAELVACRAVPVGAAGSAACTLKFSTAGPQLIQASFSGTGQYFASSSTVLDEPVRKQSLPAQGYWLATVTGSVFAAGGARLLGAPGAGGGPVVGIASAATGTGYWVVTANGTVSAYGTATYYGDLPAVHVRAGDIVGMAPTPDGAGYWLVGKDGGFFAFGDARFYGSLPGRHAHVRDIVGMAAAPGGGGYLLVGADGGVFNFGTARYFGSLPAQHRHVHDVRALLAAPAGTGYVLVGADGGAFVFGRGVRFYGSLPARNVHVPDIVGLALTPDGKGYYMAGADGRVYAFGDAKAQPAPAGVGRGGRVVGIAGT